MRLIVLGGTMDNKIRVWTRQDEKILDVLEKEGRHITKKEYIEEKMEDCSGVYLDVYSWYTEKAKAIVPKPTDVKYPIWVSLRDDHMHQPFRVPLS
jgi:putative aminopeptidase FrvX